MRAFPSEVVALLDELFPWAKTTDSGPQHMVLNPELYPKLNITAAMLAKVPTELIRLQGREMAEYVFAVSALDGTLDLYRHQRALSPRDQSAGLQWAELKGIDTFNHDNPLRILRWRLAKCPDSTPVEGTSELPFFADPDLRTTLSAELSDVGKSLASHEWKAATVLGGAALEAILYWALTGMQPQVSELAEQPAKRLDDWKLVQLIDVAHKLRLIDTSTRKLADLARDARNLVHPSAVKRERRDCDKATSLTVAAAIEAVVRDISAFCAERARTL